MTTSTPGHEPDTARNTGDIGAIPAWLLGQPHVSPGAKLLYAAIEMHVTANHGTWPSTTRLAQILGIAERTVRAHLRELIDTGAVRRHRGIGYQTGHRYELAARAEATL